MILPEQPAELLNKKCLKICGRIQPESLYGFGRAARACSTSETSIRRAVNNGLLKHHKIGHRTVMLGIYLIDWIKAGRRTGRTSAHVRAEYSRVA